MIKTRSQFSDVILTLILPRLFDISTSEIDGMFKSLPKHAGRIDAIVVILKRIVWRACTF